MVTLRAFSKGKHVSPRQIAVLQKHTYVENVLDKSAMDMRVCAQSPAGVCMIHRLPNQFVKSCAALAVLMLAGMGATQVHAQNSPKEPAAEQPAPKLRNSRANPAQAEKNAPQKNEAIANPIAQFSGLDKITGRIFSFDVAMDETVQFGALQVTPRICNTRVSTSAPQTTAFIEVDEITLKGEFNRIFTGWMFAASPGLHAVEHPVYDVWLKGCRGAPEEVIEQPKEEPTPEKPKAKPAPKNNKKPVR